MTRPPCHRPPAEIDAQAPLRLRLAMLAGQRQQALTFDPLAEDPALELMRGLIVGVSSPAPRPCLSAAAGPLAQGLVAKPAPAAVALQAQALARSRPPD